MSRALKLITVVCMAASVSAWAQDATVERALAAHGSIALSNLRTITLRGQSVIGTTRLPVTISADVAGQIRFDYGLPTTRSLVLTSEGIMEIAGDTVSYPPPHLAAFAQLDVLGIVQLRALNALASRFTTKGTGSVKTLPTVKLGADSGRQQTHYRRAIADTVDIDFDTATGVVVQIARRQYSDKSLDLSFICAWTFSKYQFVNGLAVPFVIEKSIDGRLLETITVESVALNDALPSDLFTRIGGRQ